MQVDIPVMLELKKDLTRKVTIEVEKSVIEKGEKNGTVNEKNATTGISMGCLQKPRRNGWSMEWMNYDTRMTVLIAITERTQIDLTAMYLREEEEIPGMFIVQENFETHVTHGIYVRFAKSGKSATLENSET